MPTQTIHERIRQARTDAGLTQTRLSELSGVRQGRISTLETRTNASPTVDELRELSKALGVTADWLLGLGAP